MNKETNINFSVPIEKEIKRINKNRRNYERPYFTKLESFHAIRFMTSSSSIFSDNLTERIHEV